MVGAPPAAVQVWLRWPLLAAGWLALGWLCVPADARAGVESLEIRAERVLELPWGRVRELEGVAHFALDPAAPANARIADLAYAPVEGDGRVRFDADFILHIPERLPAEPVLLLEVSNRGARGAIATFNLAPRGPQAEPLAAFGDGFLQRQDFVLAWLGWQFDVPREAGRLGLTAPVARGEHGPLRGPVRMDWTVDRPAAQLPLGHRGMRAHLPAEPASAAHVLTRRADRDALPELIGRERWRFVASGPDGALDAIELEGGFHAGSIYELVWLAEHPPVAGVGLAALRDFVSHLRHDEAAPVAVSHTLALGVSQSGRLLRHFLHDGFNVDGQGRSVFDGMLAVVAGGGRGSFNHRFAQPSLDGHPYSAFHHPVDLFPFTARVSEDPLTGARGGLFEPYPQGVGAPRLMQVNAGYEYYGRAASLLHHDATGSADLPPAPGERLYHIAGAQHVTLPLEALQPAGEGGLLRGNAIDARLNLRALLVALRDWVVADSEPPASRIARLADGTLVPVTDLALPRTGVLTAPETVHVARRLDFGPRFEREGVIDLEPPRLGAAFAARVAQVDAFGNECCGIRNPELEVPLATELPWSLREATGEGPRRLADFLGATLPLATTAALRHPDDERPAIDELYRDAEDYLARIAEAADRLIAAGFLLAEDRAAVIAAAEGRWARWAIAPAHRSN